MEKYLNDAIIGNKNMLATFSSKGEMLRLSYPNHDNRQYLKYFHTGVKVNDSNIIYLHDDINNTYIQYYDTDTNILNTEITNTYFNLKIVQTDFVTIKEDILVKKYSFINDRLLQANIKKDEAIMDEVIPLIEEVRNIWNEAYKLSVGQR